ncbi:MAG: thiolase family protein [Deltaproteobacteria bacterium]|nr:thiolase family protein [Deltaproteobacteria bacterium]MCL5792094.1 thiolase family protein [Deltaproteobacteria bacterium]
MSNVYVIGIGMIRFGKYADKTVKGMAREALELALKDANIEKKALNAVFVANSYWGIFSNQHSIKGQVMLREAGIQGIPITNVENACAGASTALHLGYMGIRAGMYDVVLALGSEKISSPDKMLSLQAYASSMDVESIEMNLQMYMELSKQLEGVIPKDQLQPDGDKSIFMDAYAMGARWHMMKFGSTQKQLAIIAAKNHWHASMNPLAQYQKSMTVDEILNDRLVSYPLTRAMCAPVGDGAAAAILCSEAFLEKLSNPRPVIIRASVLGSGTDRNMDASDIGMRLSKQVYELAGLGPEDIDTAELHDATAYGELHQAEAMGFCPSGEGGILAEAGATKLGGRLPINTSGGLESRGHPVGASGLAQIYEEIVQLRGEAGKRQVEGARIALTENGGGFIGVEEAAMCINIFEKV